MNIDQPKNFYLYKPTDAKKMLKYILFLFLLLSTQLGATSHSNIETSKPEALPLFSSLSLNLAPNPTLAMNPLIVEETLQEGITALKRGLSFSEVAESNPRSFTTIRTELGLPERSSPVSHEVLRLRGGGPKSKFSSSTEALKSTGDSDDEENVPDLESEDIQPMSSEVSKYLRKEIINNIYEECLAEVANMSIGTHVTSESTSKEAAEWNAAEKAAEFAKSKAERFLEKIRIETEEARRIADDSKRNIRELERAPKPENTAGQAVATATITYEKAVAAYAASNYKAKKLVVELAEARVETASAVLHAIGVRKSAQH